MNYSPLDNLGRVRRCICIGRTGIFISLAAAVFACVYYVGVALGNVIIHTISTEDQTYSTTHNTNCDTSWGEFSGGNNLTTTSINSDPTIWNQNYCQNHENDERCHQDYWLETYGDGGLFIHPPSKFAFCRIAKNGSTQWSKVLAKILNSDAGIISVWPHFSVPKLSIEQYGIDGVESIFSDPTATRAVMLRDPLARFASSYLDKCFGMNCTNKICYPRKHAGKEEGQKVTFREAINWLVDTNPLAIIDPHWRLQSEFCNLREHLNDFTIIGRMEKETFTSHSNCILEKARITSSEPFFKTRDEITNRMGIHYRKESEEDVLKKLYSPRMARIVMEKMYQDYEVLRLPEPAWIDDATGEWLDSTDHHVCV